MQKTHDSVSETHSYKINLTIIYRSCKLAHFKDNVTYLDFCKIDKNNKKLLEIRSFSDKQQNKLQDNGGKKTVTSTVKGKPGKVRLMQNKASYTLIFIRNRLKQQECMHKAFCWEFNDCVICNTLKYLRAVFLS